MKHRRNRLIETLSFEVELALDDGTPIHIGFNQQALDFARDWINYLQGVRGIKTDADGGDSEVNVLARKKASREGKPQVTVEDIQDTTNTMKALHKPYSASLEAQVITLVMLDCFNDLFEAVETDTGLEVTILAPFDKYVDDSETPEPVHHNPMLELMAKKGIAPRLPKIKKIGDPVEIMLDHVFALVESNPDFADSLTPYFEQAFVALKHGGRRLNDRDMSTFLASLASALSKVMDGQHRIINGEFLRTRVQQHPETDGQTIA